jgi:hypothetical protein
MFCRGVNGALCSFECKRILKPASGPELLFANSFYAALQLHQSGHSRIVQHFGAVEGQRCG